ncbi:MAG TPA: GEVED domain-containing protein, partial [Bacteroidales bacterium]|nr:GEVED domain-containing protein [Bacteroidales bacterium]
ANVLCGAINNSSGWQGGVADFTAIFTEINAGESEPITVTNGNAWASDLVTCWVDWDMSYTFDEGDEKFVLTSNGGGANFTGNIAVPAGTPNGDYRMRIRMSYSTAPTPCGAMNYGEVEDYTIKVGGGTTTAWLSVDEANLSFTLAANEVKVVPVHFNSQDLTNGTYTGAVNVASNDVNNPLVVVSSTLVVGGTTGELVVNPTSLTETHIVPPAQTTTQVLNLTNNTGAPVSWTLAIDAGTDAGALNLVPEVSTETPVYNGQIQVESQPGVTPGEMVEGPAYTNYAIYNGTRGELYNNGGFVTAPGVGPGGTDYSELQDASLGMNTYGSGCQVSAGNSIADDFVVTDNWSIESFTFFAYQTGSGNTSTLNDVRVQIYDGNPSAGGTVIWGNLTTNLMTSTSWTNSYRVLESAPATNRPIFEIVAGTSGLTLSPGTYWVEMQMGGTAASGPWAHPITIVGQTNTGNSIQKTSTGWAPLEDVGPQGLPFIITGTGTVAPWLTASPVSGTIPAGGSIPINVTFNSNELELGVYNGSVTISSTQPDLVVPVTFNVEAGGVGEPPINLAGEIVDFVNVDLTWDAPGGGFDPEWITYSNEVIGNSIGTGGAIDFDVAGRWTPDMLGEFEGGMVTKINFVPGEPGNVSTYEVKVWQGGNNNPTLKYSQAVTNIVEDEWNTVVLTTPVAIDITKELWIGFGVNTTGGHPAGCDGGPQTEGFGNMMFWSGAWTTLSQLGAGLDYDWCVKGYVEGGMAVEGYKVYRKTESGNFGLIGTTGANTLNYYDESLDYGKYFYHVTAQYADGESGPSNQIVLDITSISDPSGATSTMQVYPNPTNDYFTIKSEVELQSVIMVNYNGQVVMNRKATGNEMIINAKQFAKGVYTLQIESKDGRSIHKVVIQ